MINSIYCAALINFVVSIICFQDFAAPLLLPNVYTGYAFLLDRHNKIRWRGSGQAHPEEVQILLEVTQELLDEKF